MKGNFFMVIGRKAWEVKNSRLVLTVSDENISSVGLMIKYKNSNRCKLIKRFVGVDTFSILESTSHVDLVWISL